MIIMERLLSAIATWQGKCTSPFRRAEGSSGTRLGPGVVGGMEAVGVPLGETRGVRIARGTVQMSFRLKEN